MTKSRNETKRGLYSKYDVRKDGEVVEDCFVLEPENDSAAREALIRYAEETDDEKLAADLREWMVDLCTRGEGEAGGVSVGAGDCDHPPIKDLDSQSCDVGEKLDCGDCGKTFVVQFNGYQNRRIFVAEDVAETADGDYICPECGESHANPKTENLSCGDVCNRVTCPYCEATETFHETGCAVTRSGGGRSE